MALTISQQAQNFSLLATFLTDSLLYSNGGIAPLLYRRLSVRNVARNVKFCACWEIVRAIAITKYSYRI